MSESAALGVAEAIAETLATDTHIEKNPSTQPGTIADEPPKAVKLEDVEDAEDAEELASVAEEGEPLETHGIDTRKPKAPLPDLRFEQAYLTALRRTDMRTWSIFRVTFVDFLLWPMAQGFLWALALNGFRHLRSASTSSGKQFGTILRDALNIGGVLD
ncbi:hypothetical protein PYCC9005_001250 [Savitreella phatthalungensis]